MAASADLRVGDGVGKVSKEALDTDYRGDYIAASAAHRRKTVGLVDLAWVFEIVDLERETQAAVFLRRDNNSSRLY